ncbi:MAG TPA: OmpH family outer membrane protein [Defluviitoga sp.]|nr:OmpH family outer membrane protein [Defluviitoga sp.]HOP23825.1 OmpH family outer membrane protein [Defluviitoga sp.]HPU59513.1 OmpH family outer membrane protein [Defluviitoga tunisiensis]HPZ28428.1 OmpH family outer membrane protein [Defluviitoga sp.]HQD62526.1 OmpH family outer membrane protein [Defluviitoga sp.]
MIKNVKKMVVLGAILLFALLGFSQGTTNLKIGYVNFDKTIKNYYKWYDLQSSYQIDFQYYQNKIYEMENQFMQLQESGATDEELQQYLLKLQTTYNQYQQSLQEEYQTKIDSLVEEVVKKIAQYAEANDYDFIFYQSAVIYVKDSLDLTDVIISYINVK